MNKLISKKFFVIIITTILDILISQGVLPSESKAQLMTLITSLSGLYVTVQGIIDYFKK